MYNFTQCLILKKIINDNGNELMLFPKYSHNSSANFIYILYTICL